MLSPATAAPKHGSQPETKGSRSSVILVLICTVFAAGAQVLMKFGATHPMPGLQLGHAGSWVPFLLALLGNWQLMLGYALSACNALCLILALRDGELSLLYPIIALTYVWVNLLSMYFFREPMNFWKGAGIAFIIGGVAFLGAASSRR